MEPFYIHRPADRPGTELSLLQCGWHLCDPGYSYGPATRDHYLLHYVLAGAGTFYTDYGRHALGAGDGFMILPGERTTYTADSADPWRYVWVGFEGTGAKNLLARCNLTQRQPVFHQDTGGAIQRHIESINAFDKSSGVFPFEAIGLLYLIFSQLIDARSALARSSKRDDLLRKAVAYVDANYNQDLQVQALADALFIDRTYLYRLFRQEFNLSPIAFLRHARLRKACELLRFTNLSVTHVAALCGFADGSSFCAQFRNEYGVTPLKYRKLPLETQ